MVFYSSSFGSLDPPKLPSSPEKNHHHPPKNPAAIAALSRWPFSGPCCGTPSAWSATDGRASARPPTWSWTTWAFHLVYRWSRLKKTWKKRMVFQMLNHGFFKLMINGFNGDFHGVLSPNALGCEPPGTRTRPGYDEPNSYFFSHGRNRKFVDLPSWNMADLSILRFICKRRNQRVKPPGWLTTYNPRDSIFRGRTSLLEIDQKNMFWFSHMWEIHNNVVKTINHPPVITMNI